jgi:1,4-dihydroxy-2-naphthoate octaprenyltransferase
VFIFFGPVAVCGTYYVQAHRISPEAMALSVPPGLLITAILVVNNIRDIESDDAAGKRTLAVRMGVEGSAAWYTMLVTGAFVALPAAGALTGTFVLFLPLLALPFATRLIGVVHRCYHDGPAMNGALAGTARLTLLYCLLLSAGLLLSAFSRVP